MATNPPDLFVDPDGMVGHRPRAGAFNAGPAPSTPQPAPTGQGTPILPLVIADLQRRQEQGALKYGTVLRAHNGRSALQDALEESYDQTMYLRQLLEEWPELLAQVRREAFSQAMQVVELHLASGPEEPTSVAGTALEAQNAALRRVYADLLKLQGRAPAEPSRRRGVRLHTWRARDGVASCSTCGLERHGVTGPSGGRWREYRKDGQVLARGPTYATRMPPCTGRRSA